jgi:hypothetical protein
MSIWTNIAREISGAAYRVFSSEPPSDLGSPDDPSLARDIWDLDHLLRTTSADPRPLSRELLRALPGALERAISLEYDVFRAQVVPYLSEDDQVTYGTEDAWDRMRELVVDRLQELSS